MGDRMGKLIDITTYPARNVLKELLMDKTTKKNIIWATDNYAALGEGFQDKQQITIRALLSQPDVIKSRSEKSEEEQQARTRKKAEVFTPVWLCNRMNNFLDEEWFGRKGIFNIEKDDHTWEVVQEKIAFPERKSWKRYVDSRRLEITCGEAPFLVSRYDAATGGLIEPPERRIGLLDRKLRVVDENAADYEEWQTWALRAIDSVYGYEYQGDNLLVARVNVLQTFLDYHRARWQRDPELRLLKVVANHLAWNLWQMDGLKDNVPLGKPYEPIYEASLFAMDEDKAPEEREALPSKVHNWRSKITVPFRQLKEERNMGKKKLFDFVIGNPPYQEDKKDVGRQAKPVYNIFMDEVKKMQPGCISLVTPSRWFAGGIGLEAYRNEMMTEHHIQAMVDYPNAKEVFPNTSISGGVNYFVWKHDYVGSCAFTSILNGKAETMERQLDEFPVIVRYNDAVKIIRKVQNFYESTMDSIISPISPYALVTSTRGVKEKDAEHPLRMFSSQGTSYIGRDIVSKGTETINTYRAMISQTSAEHAGEPSKDGKFRVLTRSMRVMEPGDVCTHSYIYAGPLKSKREAENVLEYLQTKFVRFLILQAVTSIHISKSTFVFVPLQDFSQQWTDEKLAGKYGLTGEDIDYIESFIKEMA